MEVKRSEMLGWREGVRAFERSDQNNLKVNEKYVHIRKSVRRGECVEL
jgi:hypothetical protein